MLYMQLDVFIEGSVLSSFKALPPFMSLQAFNLASTLFTGGVHDLILNPVFK